MMYTSHIVDDTPWYMVGDTPWYDDDGEDSGCHLVRMCYHEHGQLGERI